VRDIDTVAVVNGLKVLDAKRPIREADIAQARQEYPQQLTFAGWVKKYTDEH
jgi:hypothetical protein